MLKGVNWSESAEPFLQTVRVLSRFGGAMGAWLVVRAGLGAHLVTTFVQVCLGGTGAGGGGCESLDGRLEVDAWRLLVVVVVVGVGVRRTGGCS